ncbi:MAG: IS630 family transposase, partial [Dehalococcoidia bacterium]|nr:IS630 family transposase [Dehalococcoidia bacterium]
MRRGRPLKPLEVSSHTREELESLANSRTLSAGLVRRAKIVLMCADGLTNDVVGQKVGLSRASV